MQQLFQRGQQRVLLALRAVGDVEGDVARVVAGELAEHCLHVRGVRRHVGDHYDDVARRQRTVVRERVQQLVVQHLHLALRTVRHVERDRAVARGIHRGPERARLVQRPQVADVVL